MALGKRQGSNVVSFEAQIIEGLLRTGWVVPVALGSLESPDYPKSMFGDLVRLILVLGAYTE